MRSQNGAEFGEKITFFGFVLSENSAMKTRTALTLAAQTICFVLCASLSHAKSPTPGFTQGVIPVFEDYAVAVVATPTTPKPVLNSARAREFRSAIRRAAREEVNFAGHYRLAIWGCGSDCWGFAIVNKINGKVYTQPGVDHVGGVMGSMDVLVDFRKDSRLIILAGALNDDEVYQTGKFYYLWNGSAMKLLGRTALKISGPNSDDAD